MTAFAMPPSSPPAPGGRALRFGTAIGVGAAAALATALPATLRIAPVVAETEGLPRVWIALAAAALGPMVVAVLVLRGAREGLRGYSGPNVELRVFGFGLWLASLLVAFALFGSVLRATTHQHALAGVTFAFGAAAIAAGSALICARLVAILRDASSGMRRALGAGLTFFAAAAVAWVGARFLAAVTRDPASGAAGSTIVDVLAFTLASLFAARRSLSRQRAFALIGPPVALVVAVLGAVTLRDAVLREAINQQAPVFAPAADWVPTP